MSGVYWIDPDGGSHGNVFQAYCDQQTDGGAGLLFGATPLQPTQVSQVQQTLSRRVQAGQLVGLTLQCPQQFLWTKQITRPWTFLCGAPLVTCVADETKPRYRPSANQRPKACSVLPGFSIIGSHWLLHMAVRSCTVIGVDCGYVLDEYQIYNTNTTATTKLPGEA